MASSLNDGLQLMDNRVSGVGTEFPECFLSRFPRPRTVAANKGVLKDVQLVRIQHAYLIICRRSSTSQTESCLRPMSPIVHYCTINMPLASADCHIFIVFAYG